MSALAALVRETPLARATAVAARLGAGVALKLECLQATGSFKLRGAVARLAALTADERARGVVSASAGNHGQGLALAARRLGVRATVVVPAPTPAIKRDAIAALGATLRVEGAGYEQAEAAARALAAATDAVFVSPFDDDLIIAGNGGSLAEELLRQAPDLRRVVVPVGGGGLIGGMAAALGPRGISVVGVQPEANSAMYDSLALGRALTAYDGGATLAEGLEGPVAERTFALVRRHADGIVRVDEAAIRRAIAFAYHVAGVVAEASAAVALAGLLEGRVAPAAGGTTAVVISGGNIDAALLDEILAEHPRAGFVEVAR